MTDTDNLEAIRKLACPVVLLSAAEDVSKLDRVIITSIAYCSLEPLMLSTPLVSNSKTGAAVIATGAFAVSILTFSHLPDVEKFSQLKDTKDMSADQKLSASGFATERTASGLLVIKDTQTIEVAVIEVVPLDTYNLVIGNVTNTGGSLDSRPLIRYNRKYVTLDESTFSTSDDGYPV
jgi:flavin reductase (DIM6/NTAB) family NADH-FMN oxidoreductase RutF